MLPGSILFLFRDKLRLIERKNVYLNCVVVANKIHDILQNLDGTYLYAHS